MTEKEQRKKKGEERRVMRGKRKTDGKVLGGEFPPSGCQ